MIFTLTKDVQDASARIVDYEAKNADFVATATTYAYPNNLKPEYNMCLHRTIVHELKWMAHFCAVVLFDRTGKRRVYGYLLFQDTAGLGMTRVTG